MISTSVSDTDPRLALPSTLLMVKWAAYGQSSSTPNATGLVTGVRYELKCLSVEFPFIKESQLLFVKYRNGTKELLAGRRNRSTTFGEAFLKCTYFRLDLVWWKAGKEVYLNSEMVELECRDRLWITNELYNSSTAIIVTSNKL